MPQDPLKGPELIREYFRDWHEPFPADLERATTSRIWGEIDALPAESAMVVGSEGTGDGLGGGRPGTSFAWQPYGPFGMVTTSGGQFSGRIVDVNVGPDGIRAVAAASGGVWIRDPAGWQAITEDLTTQWIGSLDVHPTDPNVMLVGTGEPFLRSGTGLWKTTDRGDSWTSISLSPEPATCFRLRYGANGALVHGAFDLGYYRSTDGGDTWTRRLNLGWPTDLALDPTNPNVLYLTIYDQGLFRSINGGLNWTEVMGTGLPQSDIGRGSIAVCASDPNRIYVAYARHNGSMLGTFRTTDGGSTWTDITPVDDYYWGQGWYNNTISVSPTDPDLVFAGGGGLIRSTNGGDSWEVVSSPSVHADCHASVWSNDGAEFWLGHDGGWCHTSDGGVSWTSDDNTLPITQFVLIGASSTEVPFVLGGGSQDNGISVTTDGGASWAFRHGGDGGGFAVDPNDWHVQYSTAGIYGGSWPFRRFRSVDGGVTWDQINSGIGTASQWWLRIRTDLGDPATLFTYGDGFVYRTTSGFWSAMNGNPTVFPHFVSELTASRFAEPEGTVYACLDSNVDGERLMVWNGTGFDERSAGIPSGLRIRKVPTHPRKADWAYALINGLGSPGEKIYRTTDRGLNWTNITGDLPDLPISDLIAHPTDDDRLFLGTEMGAFRSTDGGSTWERWQFGLPEAAAITELTFVDRLDDDGEFFIVAGTYGRGVWVREIGTDDASGVPDDSSDPASPDELGSVPGLLTLHAPAPNPFRESTSLSFTLRQATPIVMTVHDAAGREVLRLAEGERGPGFHRVRLEADRLAVGTYLVRLTTPEGTTSTRITHLD
ncbi:MAG: T9SS type A sorting domain-containing protein [Candidatus Eisenbacteria bacterium]|nr:T9SS type A sorting domain-containing protein [Candidatus Eisenbacteria bacterium]